MKLGHNVVRNKLFGPNFLCLSILIVYNTANNAVNYMQIHIFIVKNSALFFKKWLEFS